MLKCECFHVLQAWYDYATGQIPRRALNCPFKGKGQNFHVFLSNTFLMSFTEVKVVRPLFICLSHVEFFVCFSEFPHYLQPNMRRNVSVNVSQSKMSDGNAMLLWSLSAPCRLEGTVQLCYKSNCEKITAMQQLSEGKWKQHSKGLWVRTWCTWSLFPFNITLLFFEPNHN